MSLNYKSRHKETSSPSKKAPRSKKKKAVSVNDGGVLFSGGAIRTGGSVSQGQIGELLHPVHALHTLHVMDGGTFAGLKSIAGLTLGRRDHMSHHFEPLMPSVYNDHPSYLSPVATRDIIKSTGPLHLARMLHDEIKSNRSLVGGGLWDSIKHVFGKGREIFHKAASGVASAGHFVHDWGNKINGYVKKGLDVTRSLNDNTIRKFSPEIANVLDKGIGVVKTASDLADRGLSVADKITQGAEAAAKL